MVLQKSPERAVLWGYGPEGAQVTVALVGPTKMQALPVKVTRGKYSQMSVYPNICRMRKPS